MNKFNAKTGNGTKVLVDYTCDHWKVTATIALASNNEILDSVEFNTTDADTEFIEGMIHDYLAEQEY